MSDEQETPWQRQENEPTNWYERFLVYLQMGPSRTLLGAVHLVEKDQNRPRKISVPGMWRDVFKQWQWKSRALAFDDYRRKQVFTSGNAYDVTRAEKLNGYSERLETLLDKMLKKLEDKDKKDESKPWFNQFLYEKYLQTLEALAAETGGRVKVSKTDLTSAGEKFDNSQYFFYVPQVDEEPEAPKNDGDNP